MDPNLSLSDTAGRRVLFATILASSMAFIDGSALNVALATLLSASLHPDERGRAIGYWSSATTITTIGGLLIGGVLA